MHIIQIRIGHGGLVEGVDNDPIICHMISTNRLISIIGYIGCMLVNVLHVLSNQLVHLLDVSVAVREDLIGIHSSICALRPTNELT